MKYADKFNLLLKGVKMDEIKALEAQEAQEIAEAAAASNDQGVDDKGDHQDPDPAAANSDQDYKQLLENANGIIKDMEEKLLLNQAELDKLKNEIAAFNNKQTQQTSPEVYDETAVFKELFNNK